MEFRPLVRGRRSKNAANYARGLKQYSQYLGIKGKLPNIDQVDKPFLCNPKHLNEFGSHLIDNCKNAAKKKKKDLTAVIDAYTEDEEAEDLSRATVLCYLSTVFNIIAKKYPDCVDFKTIGRKAPEWYTELRSTIYEEITTACIDAGTTASDKSENIDREGLSVLVDDIFKSNNETENVHAFEFCTTFHSVGRVAECALTTAKSCRWDATNGGLATFQWMDRKTATQSPMNYFNDWSDFRLDWYFHLYHYLLEGGVAGSIWLFPHLQAKGTNAATHITKNLQRYTSQDHLQETFPSDLSYDGTSLRSGSCSFMSLRLPTCGFYSAMRSGHQQLLKEVRLYEYVHATNEVIAIGKSACQPVVVVFPPVVDSSQPLVDRSTKG